MKRVKYIFGLMILFIGASCASPAQGSISSPPVWNNLVPSQSTSEDALKQWPNLSPIGDISAGDQRRITFRITAGTNFSPPFKEYSLRFDHDRLQVIDIHWSNEFIEPGYGSLPEIVNNWGLPSIVTWSKDLYVRTVIWPNKGFLAYARSAAAPNTADPRAAEIWGIGFFEPVSKESFWNSPAGRLVPRENQYASGTTDAPDDDPEDPFNWDLLTSISATPDAQSP